MRPILPSLFVLVFTLAGVRSSAEIQHGEMAGYLLVPNEKVPESYNTGS